MSGSSDKFAAMIGFARRAGKAIYGFDTLRTARRLKLLCVSSAASDNLLRGMSELAAKKGVPLVRADALEDLAGSNCKALGITDANMARAMLGYAGEGHTGYTILNRTSEVTVIG